MEQDYLKGLGFNKGMVAFLKTSGKTMIFRGILLVLLSGLLFCYPVETTTITTRIIGIGLLLDGILLLGAGFRAGEGRRELLVFNGFVLVLVGCLSVFKPLAVNWLWVIVIGIWILIAGLQSLFIGGSRLWSSVFSGLILILVGGLFISAPWVGLLQIAWCLALLLMMTGTVLIVQGFRLTSSLR